MIERTNKETKNRCFFNGTNTRACLSLIAIAAITGCSGSSEPTSTAKETSTESAVETTADATKSDDSKSVKVKKASPVGDTSAFLNMTKSKKKLVGNPKKDKLNANYHFNKANQYRESKQFDEAILEYKRAIRSYPNDGAFYKNLGGTFAMVGKLKDAEVTLKRGCEVEPEDWLMWNNLAVVLQNLGKKEDCRKAIQKSLSLKPPAHAVENMQLTLKQLDSATN